MNSNSKNDEQHTRLQIGIILSFVLGVLFIVLAFTVGRNDDEDDKNDNNNPNPPENGDGGSTIVPEGGLICKLSTDNQSFGLNNMEKPGFFRQGDVDMMILSNALGDVRENHFRLTLENGTPESYSPQNFSIRIFEQKNTNDPDKPPFFIELETSYNRMQLFQVTEGVDESEPERRLLSSESLDFDETSNFMQYHMEAVGLRRVENNTYMVHLSALWLQNEQCNAPTTDDNREQNKNEHRVVYIGLNERTGNWDIVQMVELTDVKGRVYSITLQDDDDVKMLVYVDMKGQLHRTFSTGADDIVSDDTVNYNFSSISPIFTMNSNDQKYCYVYAWDSGNLYRVGFSFVNNDSSFEVDKVTLNNGSKDFSSSDDVYVNNLTSDGSMFALYDQDTWSVYAQDSPTDLTSFQHLHTSSNSNINISDIEGLLLDTNNQNEISFNMWVATDEGGVTKSIVNCS